MSAGVLVALPGPVEGALVKAVDSGGGDVRVVRRCADVPEVLAAAAAGLGSVAVLAADMPAVDRTTVSRLRAVGVRTLLVARPRDLERCAALGADAVHPDDVALDVLADTVVALARAAAVARPPRDGTAASRRSSDVEPAAAGPARHRDVTPGDDARTRDGAGADDDGRDRPGERGGDPTARGHAPEGPSEAVAGPGEPPAPPAGEDGPGDVVAPERGRVVVVWGPAGAPGRTTVAVTLAAELAALTGGALLIDADTEAPAVTQALGLLEDSSALAVAARQATHGRLDAVALAQLAPVVDGGLRVLTGLTRADRWRELPASALEVVWDLAREVAPWTVVDVGAGLEIEAGFDPAWAPQRHQATAAALAAADVVVVVGAGEPVGVRRLVLALGELSDRDLLSADAERIVLVNRVRASAAGPRPTQSVTEALARFAGVGAPVLVPDDRPATDRAMLQGRTLTDVAATSPARLALHELACRLTGADPGRRRRRPTRRRVPARLAAAAHAR